MYMLRLISAVLHERARGAPSRATALDLRPAEVGVLVPLVACLLALSAWPAAITDHTLRPERPRRPGAHATSVEPFDVIAAAIATPHVDWFALAPMLVAARRRRRLPARRGARARELAAAASRAVLRGGGFVGAFVVAAFLYTQLETPAGRSPAPSSRDRLGALAALIVAGPACSRSASRWREPACATTTSPSTTPCSRRPAPG